jgi:hypothetical protein
MAEAVWIVQELIGQVFDRSIPLELRISGSIDAHPARPGMTRDLVMCQFAGSDHGLSEVRVQILSNYLHPTHSFDTYDRQEMKMNLSA